MRRRNRGMRRLLAAGLLAATALLATASYASQGCVTAYLGLGDDSSGDNPYVTQNPDGSITIHPERVGPTATRFVARTQTFVACVV